jgi:hypothetical protein
VGTSKNALLIQIWAAMIAIFAAEVAESSLHDEGVLIHLVSMPRLNLFTYRDLGNGWRTSSVHTAPCATSLPIFVAGNGAWAGHSP